MARARLAPFFSILWDLDDDARGNVQHIAEHGLTIEEVTSVMRSPSDHDVSRSSGYPVLFGDTGTGRHIMVVYEAIGSDIAYPITAFEVPKRAKP